MSADFLLDALGLLDDDLIADAEALPARAASPSRVRRWAALAACLAVVLFLGYGAARLSLLPWEGGGGLSSGGNAPDGGAAGEASPPDDSSGGAVEPPSPGSASGADSSAGDWHAAIQVDGVLYWSTGQVLAAEVEESAIRETTSYICGLPEEEGQTNFAPAGTPYAVTGDGVAVLLDGEWVLFSPVPPWESQD